MRRYSTRGQNDANTFPSESLKGMEGLVNLRLWRTRVTDSGLRHLEGLVNLRSLKLSDNQVSDSGLEHLKVLTKLEELDLRAQATRGGKRQRFPRRSNYVSMSSVKTDR